MFDEVPPQRRQLGAALRRLRLAADLTGRQLADSAGVSQSTVSRLERGEAVPSATDVEQWVRATGASEEDRAELLRWADQAGTEATSWRRDLRRGLPRLQRDVHELETAAATIRNFQPVLVPGLLQTAEYARRLYTAGYPSGRPDIPAAIAARMQRQSILYDDSKRLEFIIAEPALRWRFGPASLMLAQLDRITAVATLSHVDIAVLPQTADLTPWQTHGFNIFEDRGDEQQPVVHFETLTTDITVTDPSDVDIYREAFAALGRSALVGDEAHAVLRTLMAELNQPES